MSDNMAAGALGNRPPVGLKVSVGGLLSLDEIPCWQSCSIVVRHGEPVSLAVSSGLEAPKLNSCCGMCMVVLESVILCVSPAALVCFLAPSNCSTPCCSLSSHFDHPASSFW